MADLRGLAGDLGWTRPETYIQSGNLIFEAAGERPALEGALEQAIEREFGLSIPVIVRSAADWPAYVGGNPFPAAAEHEPNRLMLLLAKRQPDAAATQALQERARDGERVALEGDALWIHYAGGAGTSKLVPALIDRLVGAPCTARNWLTVMKLGTLLER